MSTKEAQFARRKAGRSRAGRRVSAEPTALQMKLASKVVDSLIDSNASVGYHLREQALAAQFGVSRSPIRGALKYLQESGVLVAKSNLGYFLVRPIERLERLSTELPKAEDEKLYERIIGERFRGKLDDQFMQAEFLRRFGVSTATLRRVLMRMAEDGLIQRNAGHRWSFVPAISSVESHDESYRFRLMVEPAGLLEPTFRADKDRLQRSRARHQAIMERKVAVREFFETNADFHEMLATFSGNRFVLQAVQQQNRMRRLAEFKARHDYDRVMVSCQEHLQMLDAIEGGDLPWASSLMRRHLEIAGRLKLAFKA
jgi:DNA-binding GntR family transcriptional regulator